MTIHSAYDTAVKSLERKIRKASSPKTLSTATLEDKIKLQTQTKHYRAQLHSLRRAVFDIEDGVVTIEEVLDSAKVITI